jgi:hypothetical protein
MPFGQVRQRLHSDTSPGAPRCHAREKGRPLLNVVRGARTGTVKSTSSGKSGQARSGHRVRIAQECRPRRTDRPKLVRVTSMRRCISVVKLPGSAAASRAKRLLSPHFRDPTSRGMGMKSAGSKGVPQDASPCSRSRGGQHRQRDLGKVR